MADSPRMPAFDVVVLGDANPDLVMRTDELVAATGQREVLVEGASLTVGGSGAIFACGAARLGLRVAFVGMLGRDAFGRFMEEALRERGVDVSHVVWRDDVATGVSVVLSAPEDRGIYTASGTIAMLDAASVDNALLGDARHVHVSSYFLQHALRPDLASLLDHARAGGATTSLDPNWDPSERWDDGLLEVLGQLDVFLPNGAEAMRIARLDDVPEAARTLAERAGLVVAKLGEEGSLAAHGDDVTLADAVPVVDVVDTTGAGDAFDAGFVRAILEGWPLERALEFVNACGALSCRGVGGVASQPTFDEAVKLI
jgi:sugar/nucleoside kinase (ribokinase family)